MANTRYRGSYSRMGREAKALLVSRVAQLGEDAIKYAFDKGFRSHPRKEKLSDGYIAWLKSHGKSVSSAWDDITYNLRDSFGSAVYINGELQENTIRFANDTPKGRRTTDGIDPRSGREALMDYFHKIHPHRGKNEITLICVAAMYYTKFLQEGTHAGGYKIKVISTANDYIKRNWSSYVDGIYKVLKIKKPATRVIKGDIQPLKDSGFYEQG